MKKSMLRIAVFGMLAAAISTAPLQAFAQVKNEGKRPPVLVYYGEVSAIDKTAKTVRVGPRTYQVNSETKINKKNGEAVTLDDVAVGESVAGDYKETDNGKMIVRMTLFGRKVEGEAGRNKNALIEYQLRNLDKLASNELSVVYIFLCRTNGPTLVESLLAKPAKNPNPDSTLSVSSGVIIFYDGEVVETESKERVGYRFLATRQYDSSWDKDDNEVRVGFSVFPGMREPEWDWFGTDVKVNIVLTACREEGIRGLSRRLVFARFLVPPTEMTVKTEMLMTQPR